MSSTLPTLEEANAILIQASVSSTLASVSRMAGGESGGAHLLTFVDDAPPLVLKLYPAENSWTLAKEVYAYRLMKSERIKRIPKLLGGAAARESVIGRPYLLMTKLPGMSVEELTPAVSSDEVIAIYRQMGALLREIHRVRRERFGYRLSTAAGADDANEVFMRRVFEERAAAYMQHTGDRALVDAARAYLMDRLELFALCTEPVLLHGDFHEGNVIVDMRAKGATVTGVIDLENAMAGDPVADFARLDYFSIHMDGLKQDAFFDGYGDAPADWDRRRDLYQLVQAFELWVWYRQDGHHDYLAGVEKDIHTILART